MVPSIDNLLWTLAKDSKINLHLVDIENLAGTGFLTTPTVERIEAQYYLKTQSTPGDVFLIAAGPQNKHALFNGWHQGTRIFQFRKGKDGADQSLVCLFTQIENLENFAHVFLASGDAGLLQIAQRAKQAGLGVTVVTGVGAMSSKYKNYSTIKIAEGI